MHSKFRFSVKLPKTITHVRKLRDCEPLLDKFMAQAGALGSKLGCLLVQLPPSLALDLPSADRFLQALRERWGGDISAEPRHASWFGPEAQDLFAGHRVARVLADPVRHEAGARPGGHPGMVYLRLHGSPRIYYSAYEPDLIAALARRIGLANREGAKVWCIFDNTAAAAATDNALGLLEAVHREMA